MGINGITAIFSVQCGDILSRVTGGGGTAIRVVDIFQGVGKILSEMNFGNYVEKMMTPSKILLRHCSID